MIDPETFGEQNPHRQRQIAKELCAIAIATGQPADKVAAAEAAAAIRATRRGEQTAEEIIEQLIQQYESLGYPLVHKLPPRDQASPHQTTYTIGEPHITYLEVAGRALGTGLCGITITAPGTTQHVGRLVDDILFDDDPDYNAMAAARSAINEGRSHLHADLSVPGTSFVQRFSEVLGTELTIPRQNRV